MSSSSYSQAQILLLIFSSLFLSNIVNTNAVVPPSSRFRYVNTGDVGDYFDEYLSDYRPLDPFAFPFRLCFYNSTPDVYYLAIRMGSHRTESPFRWVWEANRGHPVHDNATLTFGADGDLILADADGTVAWRTGTANKGVVGFKLLPNGNMVLHDKKGQFKWQSFDHPTDTLLSGQVLRSTGPTKITSRSSMRDASDGVYSLVLEQKRFAMYVKSSDSGTSASMIYYDSLSTRLLWSYNLNIYTLAFNSTRDSFIGHTTEQRFDFEYGSSPADLTSESTILARPKYNATLSFLRLDFDGNLRIYTFFKDVDTGSWETTFVLFSRDGFVDECGWPSRCGKLGVCQNNQCVACPSPKGLLGWSSACSAPVSGKCDGGKGLNYYKVAGVEHFADKYDEGQGPVKLAECRDKCTKDCACRGFFYRDESSKCLISTVLGTLIKVDNSSHNGYIKVYK